MRFLLFFIASFFAIGCNTDPYDMEEFHKMYGTDIEDIQIYIKEVSEKKIYFGHQSVGFNILAGIEGWKEFSDTELNILETKDFNNTGNATFIHYRIGSNGKPTSKIDDFVSIVEDIPIGSESVAFFKLCYVDIMGDTDVDDLFNYYRQKINRLNESQVRTEIVLVTVPLTAVQTGWKVTAKKILNKEPYGFVENVKRNDFNTKLKDEFSGVFPIFDLAGIESTLPDGSQNTFKYKGDEYPSISSFYTSDGGHLNDYGAKIVSYNLLAFLSNELE